MLLFFCLWVSLHSCLALAADIPGMRMKTFNNCQASLVAQLVKNLPAMQETPLQFLGREDPLEKGKATHSSILAWRIYSLRRVGDRQVG